MRNALVLLNCDTGEYSEDKQTNEQISNVLKMDADNRSDKESLCRRWI